MPTDSMSAYMVTGPTKMKPRFFKSRASALDSGEVVGTSSAVRGRGVVAGL